jgi:hypothetical protein
LYTNISIEKAIRFITSIDPSLKMLAAIIMQNNYFEYNQELYKQLEGIAMGTPAAVAIANLYMALAVDRIIAEIPGVRAYIRFIDDIGLIFTGSKSKVDELFQTINNLCPELKFTMVCSNAELDILDLTFYVKNGRLEHKTFQKAMNKYLYIPPFSTHPPATISGFIKGELIRYQRTNSEYVNRLAMEKLFLKRLTDRSYSKNYVLRLIEKVKAVPQPIAINDYKDTGIVVTPYIPTPRTQALVKVINRPLEPRFGLPFSKVRAVWSTLPNIQKLALRSSLSQAQSNYLASVLARD